MIDAGQEGVFAAGTGDGRAQFRVGGRAAEGRRAPHDPEEEQGEGGLDVQELEAEAGEDTGADHAGHDDRGGGVGAVAFPGGQRGGSRFDKS